MQQNLEKEETFSITTGNVSRWLFDISRKSISQEVEKLHTGVTDMVKTWLGGLRISTLIGLKDIPEMDFQEEELLFRFLVQQVNGDM
jgi:hypothetical protein